MLSKLFNSSEESPALNHQPIWSVTNPGVFLNPPVVAARPLTFFFYRTFRIERIEKIQAFRFLTLLCLSSHCIEEGITQNVAPPVPSLCCFKVSPNRKQNENEILIFEINHDLNLLIAKAKT